MTINIQPADMGRLSRIVRYYRDLDQMKDAPSYKQIAADGERTLEELPSELKNIGLLLVRRIEPTDPGVTTDEAGIAKALIEWAARNTVPLSEERDKAYQKGGADAACALDRLIQERAMQDAAKEIKSRGL